MPSWKKVIVSGSAASLSTLTTSGAVTSKGNLQVRKSFPDIALRADNEQRLNFVDDGNAIQSGIKNNAGTMKFYGNSSSTKIRMTIDDDEATFTTDILPSADATYDLGSGAARWANLFTADLNLSNEGTQGNDVDGTNGNWTIQEGAEDLYLLNNKNGKKYKFKLEEIT